MQCLFFEPIAAITPLEEKLQKVSIKNPGFVVFKFTKRDVGYGRLFVVSGEINRVYWFKDIWSVIEDKTVNKVAHDDNRAVYAVRMPRWMSDALIS